MRVAQLISELSKLDPDLPVRAVVEGIEENLWVYNVEVSNLGESGFELDGEVRLLTSE